MSSINKVCILGRVGRDPEVRTTANGNAVVNLSVATSEKWKDRNSGEQREKSEWHKIVIFNEGLARVAQNYIKKGSQIYIEGQLQTRKWTDNNGTDKYTTEIVLQNYRGELVLCGGSGQGSNNQGGYSGGNGSDYDGSPSGDDLDSDIPF